MKMIRITQEDVDFVNLVEESVYLINIGEEVNLDQLPKDVQQQVIFDLLTQRRSKAT